MVWRNSKFSPKNIVTWISITRNRCIGHFISKNSKNYYSQSLKNVIFSYYVILSYLKRFLGAIKLVKTKLNFLEEKFWFLTKISIFNQSFDFWLRSLTNILQILQYFYFYQNFYFYCKILIFGQYFDLWPRFLFIFKMFKSFI